jgi:hypothetical protein
VRLPSYKAAAIFFVAGSPRRHAHAVLPHMAFGRQGATSRRSATFTLAGLAACGVVALLFVSRWTDYPSTGVSARDRLTTSMMVSDVVPDRHNIFAHALRWSSASWRCSRRWLAVRAAGRAAPRALGGR